MDRRRQSMPKLHQNMYRMHEKIITNIARMDQKINQYMTRMHQNMIRIVQRADQGIVMMNRDWAEICQCVAKLNEDMDKIDQGMARMDQGLARIGENMATMERIIRNPTRMQQNINQGMPRMNLSSTHIMHQNIPRIGDGILTMGQSNSIRIMNQNTPRMILSMPRSNESAATIGQIIHPNTSGRHQTTNGMNQIINSTMPQNMPGTPPFQFGRNQNFTGLSTTDINRLPTRTYVASGSTSESSQERTELNNTCAVCMFDFETGDNLRVLQCFHEFHTSCIDPWFAANRIYPVCRLDVNLYI